MKFIGATSTESVVSAGLQASARNLLLLEGLMNFRCNEDQLVASLSSDERERLEEKLLGYSIMRENGCLEWTRCFQGYGQICWRRDWPTHRLAYAPFVGPIGNSHILHSCDNPRCINWIDHLWLGDHSQNMEDMAEKGRGNKGTNVNVGESHGQAKLTEADVVEILDAEKYHGLNCDLARQYGVSETTIRDVRASRSWKHLHNFSQRIA